MAIYSNVLVFIGRSTIRNIIECKILDGIVIAMPELNLGKLLNRFFALSKNNIKCMCCMWNQVKT